MCFVLLLQRQIIWEVPAFHSDFLKHSSFSLFVSVTVVLFHQNTKQIRLSILFTWISNGSLTVLKKPSKFHHNLIGTRYGIPSSYVLWRTSHNLMKASLQSDEESGNITDKRLSTSCVLEKLSYFRSSHRKLSKAILHILAVGRNVSGNIRFHSWSSGITVTSN